MSDDNSKPKFPRRIGSGADPRRIGSGADEMYSRRVIPPHRPHPPPPLSDPHGPYPPVYYETIGLSQESKIQEMQDSHERKYAKVRRREYINQLSASLLVASHRGGNPLTVAECVNNATEMADTLKLDVADCDLFKDGVS